MNGSYSVFIRFLKEVYGLLQIFFSFLTSRNGGFQLLYIWESHKYCHTGHFEFHADENLKNICNAPTDKSGVYIVWTILDGNKQLLYIGRSGKKENGVIVDR